MKIIDRLIVTMAACTVLGPPVLFALMFGLLLARDVACGPEFVPGTFELALEPGSVCEQLQ
jgi:hypothetical protein